MRRGVRRTEERKYPAASSHSLSSFLWILHLHWRLCHVSQVNVTIWLSAEGFFCFSLLPTPFVHILSLLPLLSLSSSLSPPENTISSSSLSLLPLSQLSFSMICHKSFSQSVLSFFNPQKTSALQCLDAPPAYLALGESHMNFTGVQIFPFAVAPSHRDQLFLCSCC